MDKPVNLMSLINAYNDLSESTFDDYLNNKGISINEQEIQDMNKMIESMLHTVEQGYQRQLFDNFYIGFTINQISKEFGYRQ
ncbi:MULTISPECIES: hypothetical protein [Allobacillus]|uniref:Uncharacterized protein n=1 Tax=Allobacillus salarius TaxID=1955272 RepID=A0A556PDD2_9BACI|nr:hypothetical protein [Allobacillus salarius]TSJ62402.1 hypothetical protein FPQ13_10450 [Allobacillus salarius]